jgi:hypothetical protein
VLEQQLELFKNQVRLIGMLQGVPEHPLPELVQRPWRQRQSFCFIIIQTSFLKAIAPFMI